MIYGAVRENSSNYQLPQFLALWPELEADVWIMSPEYLAGFLGPEKMIETSVSLYVSQMYQISSVGGKAQALAGCPSDVPKDAGPQTEASHGCFPWEASSELCEHLDGFLGVQIPWSMLVLSLPD